MSDMQPMMVFSLMDQIRLLHLLYQDGFLPLVELVLSLFCCSGLRFVPEARRSLAGKHHH